MSRGVAICHRLHEKSDPRSVIVVPRPLVHPTLDIDKAAAAHRCMISFFEPSCVEETTPEKLLPLFRVCADNGDWLVIVMPDKADTATWCDLLRHLARELITFLPEDHLPNRELFRCWLSTEKHLDLDDRMTTLTFPSLLLKLVLQAVEETKPTRPSSAKIVRRRVADPVLSTIESYQHHCRRSLGRDSDSESDDGDTTTGSVFLRSSERTTGSPLRGSRLPPISVEAAIAVELTSSSSTKKTLPGAGCNAPMVSLTQQGLFDHAAGDTLQRVNGTLLRLFTRDAPRAYEELRFLDSWATQVLVDTPSQDHFEVSIPFDHVTLQNVMYKTTDVTTYCAAYSASLVAVDVFVGQSGLRECKVFSRQLKALRHPTLLETIGTTADSSRYFCIVREFAAFGNLKGMLANAKDITKDPLTLRDFFTVVRNMAIALECIHLHGFVAGENVLTAANVMRCDDRSYKLRLRGILSPMVKPLDDVATDMNALGFLMCEMITYGRVRYIPKACPRRPAECPIELWHNIVRPCFNAESDVPTLTQIVRCCDGFGCEVTATGVRTHVSFQPTTKMGF